MVKNKEANQEIITPEESFPQDEQAVVEIPVDKLQSVMDRLEDLEKSNQALRETVSSTRLQEAEEKQDEDKRPRVHFKIMDGKVVIGWPESVGSEKKNELIFNPNTNSPMGEILKSVYYYADGTKSELIDQIRFIRATDVAYARVVKDDGDYGVIEFEDKSLVPEPIRIHKRYWNA